jgi:predicted MFS family arabinose efflux permease
LRPHNGAYVRSPHRLLLAFSTGCIVANIYYVQPLLADIALDFGLSIAQVGVVAMLAQVGTGLGLLFSCLWATSTSAAR